jgi:hypothetical protein
MGMGGPVGLDFGVATEVARAMGTGTDQSFFEKLAAFESAAIGEMRKKNNATK